MSGGDDIFDAVLGKEMYYATLPAANDSLVAVLLKTVGAGGDEDLNNYTTLAAILAATGYAECNTAGYSRVTLSGIVTPAVDTSVNTVTFDTADVTFPAIGDGSHQQVVKLVICYNPDTVANGALGVGHESALIPLSFHNFDATTDGTDLVGTINNLFRAA